VGLRPLQNSDIWIVFGGAVSHDTFGLSNQLPFLLFSLLIFFDLNSWWEYL
jgi:hypothetical protein